MTTAIESTDTNQPDPGIAIETRAISKAYKEVVALDRVDLRVKQGSIYGLVGPNGAGKTTMLGLISGLRSATGGSLRVSSPYLGVLPDTPQFDRWMTGREVVDLARTLATRDVPASAVDEVLDTVGLTGAAGRAVRGYSRGMLQRLGLAAAVVVQPDILLLDEPAAALDPAGRREVLNLVRALHGKSTVLFSSHILDDVQEVCDEIGILRRGEMVYQGSLDGLLSRHVKRTYAVRVDRGAEGIATTLRTEDWVRSATAEGDHRIDIVVSDLRAAHERLVPLLAEVGVPVIEVRPGESSLEEVFLEVTQ